MAHGPLASNVNSPHNTGEAIPVRGTTVPRSDLVLDLAPGGSVYIRSMRIGELARLAQLSPKAIRRYEALGLVAPERHPNGFREYDDHTVRLVQEIRTLNRLGIPVEETRPFLDCLATGSEHVDDCPASLAEYQRTIDALSAEIAALTARRDALTDRLRDAKHRHRTTTRMLPWPRAVFAQQTHPGRAMARHAEPAHDNPTDSKEP